MDDHITKPIRLDALQGALRQWGRPRATLLDEPEPMVPPAPQSEEPLLDDEVVQQLQMLPGTHGTSLLAEVVAMYLQDDQERLARITTLVHERQSRAIESEAHSLASTAASFGATEVRRHALAVERAAREAQWPQGEAALRDLHAACRRLRVEVHRLGLTDGDAT